MDIYQLVFILYMELSSRRKEDIKLVPHKRKKNTKKEGKKI